MDQRNPTGGNGGSGGGIGVDGSGNARRRRWTPRRLGVWAICLLIGALIAGELAARYIVGLGDPPLFVLDPQIEYLLAPNQNCRRFGNEFQVNTWSMRCDNFAEKKAPAEIRVMVVGDSIVNGGTRVDQKDLATTLLPNRLAAQTGRPFVVGNISAGSWGPPNQLAYVKKFGLFDADVVVIVMNSDDYDDVPGLEYVGSAWPQKKPTFALQELIGVYGWKAVCRLTGWAAEPPPPLHMTSHEQDMEICRKAFVELVELARAKGAKVAVVQYLKKPELRGGTKGGPQAGYDIINEWARTAGVDLYSTTELFKRDLDTPGAPDPYLQGDDMHTSAHGQALLADVLEQAVKQAVAPKQ